MRMKKLLCTVWLCVIAITVNAQGRADGGGKGIVPLVDAAPFDTVMGGKGVKLYTITNGVVTAQITNYGAFLVGLFSPDKNGKYENLVTGYESVGEYTKYNLGRVGPTVGRYANRIANGTFSLKGQEYQVTRNNGQHTLHGGNEGFDRVVWDVVKATKQKLVLQCVLEDGKDGFPGTLTTRLVYSITKENGLRLEFESTTDKTTIVNTTLHSYFNLEGIGHGDIMNHELTINADNITEADRANIPTGKLLAVDGTPYDFRSGVRLGERIMAMPKRGGGFRPGMRMEIPEGKVFQYDNNFCLNHKKRGAVELVASLYSPISGRKMELLNNHPGLQVYSGARTAIALESQMYPDSPNHPEFPSVVLNPKEVYRHVCEYRLSVDKEHAAPDYELIWSEEFDKDGTVDRSKWNFEKGFCRNHELQWYQEDNAYVRNGVLTIEALSENRPNPLYKADSKEWRESRKDITCTSSSINTRGKFSFLYGRLECRARIPDGYGSWPAIWLLGENLPWPSNGEIDVMEYYRIKDVPHILANAAWGSEKAYNAIWNSKTTPLSHFTEKDPFWISQFHVWRMDWDEKSIKIYLDDELLNDIDLSTTVNKSKDGINPFHHPQYILLNLAIGGDNGGRVDFEGFPMRYDVDYVRVYRRK